MRIIFFLVGWLIFSSCHKDGPGEPPRYELAANPAWPAEQFKRDYTIQIPSGFKGGIVIGYEGNSFRKYNETDSTVLSYGYCTGVYCYDFGDTLKNINQTRIEGLFDYKRDTVQLTQRVDFVKNNEITGIYYHNESDLSYGKLFWKKGDFYREALDTRYRKENNRQVIEIIRTIKQK